MSADRFTDQRGTIQDLLGPVSGITEIFTRRGCVRGNHVHEQTTQWAYVVSGRMLFASGYPGSPAARQQECGPGEMTAEAPGTPHAWRAVEDCLVLVFTQGPRAGTAYETDTIRLDVPLLAPAGEPA